MSRKYRQPGYQDRDRNGEEPTGRRSERTPTYRDGPRSPRMPGMQRVIKCAMCGKRLPPGMDDVTSDTQCPECGADLHTCKNCAFFNPGVRFECEQPVTSRVTPKDKRNVCEYFEIRSTVERETSSGGLSPSDARQAFENLFKR